MTAATTRVELKDRPLPGMPRKGRSTAARLGYDAEHAVALYLASYGYVPERPRAGSSQDRGDLTGLPVVVSIKNRARLELAGWLDAIPRMCSAAGLPHGVVWHKRRGRGSPADWYVTMTGSTFAALLHHYEGANPS